MFNNIGGKIKGFAQIVCWLGIIGSIITGLVFIGIGSDTRDGGGLVILGILIAIVGSLTSWIGSFLTYGFGQLVENSDALTKQDKAPASAAVNMTPSLVDQNVPKAKKANTFTWQPVDESTALIVGETNIKCANCHRVQFKGNKLCNQCGAKFTKIEMQE